MVDKQIAFQLRDSFIQNESQASTAALKTGRRRSGPLSTSPVEFFIPALKLR